MTRLLSVDWSHVFVPSMSIAEIVARGTLVYVSLFVLLRFVLKRRAGTVGIPDLLVIVLIADAAQNAMAADYHSVTEGVILVATIIFWSYALDWLCFQFPRVERLLRPSALPLVKDGRLLRRNMRQELVTTDELMSMLREQGIERLDEVEMACMEGEGHLSVVAKGQKSRGQPERRIG